MVVVVLLRVVIDVAVIVVVVVLVVFGMVVEMSALHNRNSNTPEDSRSYVFAVVATTTFYLSRICPWWAAYRFY